MDKPVKEIKDRLRLALNKREVSPKELSDKTGIPKSSISQYMSGYAKPKQDRIFLICKALNINEAWLLGYDVPMDGEIVVKTEYNPSLNRRDERDIEKRLEETLNQLEGEQGGLMFSGAPMDDSTRELLILSLRNSMEIAKHAAKQKYTPKKYSKEP